MQKLAGLSEGLFDRFKKKPVEKEIYKDAPNIWTHTTYSEELIKHLLDGGKFLGAKEDLKQFNKPVKGTNRIFVNTYAPNFKKGSIFPGYEVKDYLITTQLPDSAFQPNWNNTNYDSLKDSQDIAVLRPQYRDADNFKLYKKNSEGNFELINQL
jgi:hypothetical protein